MLPWILPFALLAAWRTHAYARRVLAGRSDGWKGVGEAIAFALGVFALLSVPGMLKHPTAVPSSLLAYLALVTAIGFVIGLVLWVAATIVLHLKSSPLHSALALSDDSSPGENS